MAVAAAEGIQGRRRAATGTGVGCDAATTVASTGASRDTATTTGVVCTDVPLAADHGGGRCHRSRAVRAQHQEQATRVQRDLP